MGGKRLQWVRRLRVVIGKEKVPNAIVERVVQASLALEGVSLA
jgi:hypothetical protein